MSIKSLSVGVLSALVLTIGGAFVVQRVAAQVTCTSNAQCSGGLVCVSSGDRNYCNLPPPIWDARVSGQSQNAQLFLQGTSTTNSARLGDLQIGLGNQINNLGSGAASREIGLQYQSGNQGFTVYNGGTEPRLRVDGAGNVSIAQGLNVGTATGAASGEIRASGRVTAGSICVGGYQGLSTAASDGNAGGYREANLLCPAGQHVCTAEEIIRSIACGVTLPSSGSGWVSGGPPGFTAAANDCAGWMTNDPGALGRIWVFTETGGRGAQTLCDSSIGFTCCR